MHSSDCLFKLKLHCQDPKVVLEEVASWLGLFVPPPNVDSLNKSFSAFHYGLSL